jgi:hypothetical protein
MELPSALVLIIYFFVPSVLVCQNLTLMIYMLKCVYGWTGMYYSSTTVAQSLENHILTPIEYELIISDQEKQKF